MIALLNHMKQFSTYVVNSAERLTVELELRLGGGGGGGTLPFMICCLMGK